MIPAYKKKRPCDACNQMFLPWMCQACNRRHYFTCKDCIEIELSYSKLKLQIVEILDK